MRGIRKLAVLLALLLLFGLAGERGVLVGGDGSLVDDRRAVPAEDPEADPVRLPVTLHGEAVRRVDEPERRRHPLGRRGKSEQPAHDPTVTLPLLSVAEIRALS